MAQLCIYSISLIHHKDDSENGIPYHPSIPEGNAETWRKFPPAYRVETAMTNNSHPLSQPRQSSVPSENPIVSRYYSAAHAVQPQPREPMPPSRTWSTIPSVRRESMAPRRGYEEDAIADETDDLDTIPQAQSTLRQTTPSRRSTVRTIGQLPSIHERHLVEYPKTKYPKTVNVKQVGNVFALLSFSHSNNRSRWNPLKLGLNAMCVLHLNRRGSQFPKSPK